MQARGLFACPRLPIYLALAMKLACIEHVDPGGAALLLQALDLFNTAIVSPVYYVMFTLLTIVASLILFRVSLGCWQGRGRLLEAAMVLATCMT